MLIARMVLAGLAVTAVLGIAGQERAPGVQRLSFLVEVDVERARQVGWKGPDAEAVVGLAAQLVQQRFVAMERAVNVELDPGALRFRVSLPSIDPRDRELFEGMLRSMGVCEFLVVAEPSDGIDLIAEQEKLDAWRVAHPDDPIDAFNMLDPEDGGPARRLAWFGTAFGTEQGIIRGPPMAVRVPAQAADYIGGASFERCYSATDQWGYPAFGFELRAACAADFERFTGESVNRRLAIVIRGEIRSAPNLDTKLVRGGIIEGRFTEEEAKGLMHYIEELRGPLRLVEER